MSICGFLSRAHCCPIKTKISDSVVAICLSVSKGFCACVCVFVLVCENYYMCVCVCVREREREREKERERECFRVFVFVRIFENKYNKLKESEDRKMVWGLLRIVEGWVGGGVEMGVGH